MFDCRRQENLNFLTARKGFPKHILLNSLLTPNSFLGFLPLDPLLPFISCSLVPISFCSLCFCFLTLQIAALALILQVSLPVRVFGLAHLNTGRDSPSLYMLWWSKGGGCSQEVDITGLPHFGICLVLRKWLPRLQIPTPCWLVISGTLRVAGKMQDLGNLEGSLSLPLFNSVVMCFAPSDEKPIGWKCLPGSGTYSRQHPPSCITVMNTVHRYLP